LIRKTPDGASIALGAEGARLFAPSAERNRDAIATLVSQVAPLTGRALEIASGTGQHIAALAASCPGLHWYPTDVLPDRLASIDAYAADSGLANIASATNLDVTKAGWGETFENVQFVFLSNLLHLISSSEVRVFLSECANALETEGKFLVYGPFKRNGVLTSPGDQAFHDSLTAQDPDIGYEDVSDVINWASASKLQHLATHEMPANNLALLFTKVG
jgi:hypothetical protein